MDRFCTSFAQQRLWFLDQYQPGTSLYNVPEAWRIRGELDASALARSLDEIVRRHEVLRTTFAAEGGMPIQIVAPPERVDVKFVVLSADSAALSGDALRQYVDAEAQRPFDLAVGPLVRASLIELAAGDHLFLLTLHHIVSDGWSMPVLLHELSVLYEAFVAGRPSPLDDLSIQYADFSVWQRDVFEAGEMQEHLAYWQRELDGASSAVALPSDRPRPAVPSGRGELVEFDLGHDLSECVRQLSEARRTTMFMTTIAAFVALLHRYTAECDLNIGYPVANRTQQETENLIGFFVNTLVLRARFDPCDDFLSLLDRVREKVLDGDAHQDLPFEKIVEASRPDRNASHPPLFQIMFAFSSGDDDTPAAGLRLGESKVSAVRSERHTAKFELSLDLSLRGGRLAGAFEFSTDIFDRATIDGMASHYRNLLESVCADPRVKVCDLEFLDAREKSHLLGDWSGGVRSASSWRDRCVHQLFEDRVDETPDAIALESQDRHLTYADLNARANRLARELSAAGVTNETLVAVLLDRSVAMTVAILAILKVGGAYVPLDPRFPRERLNYILADTGLRFLVTRADIARAIDVGEKQIRS